MCSKPWHYVTLFAEPNTQRQLYWGQLHPVLQATKMATQALSAPGTELETCRLYVPNMPLYTPQLPGDCRVQGHAAGHGEKQTFSCPLRIT